MKKRFTWFGILAAIVITFTSCNTIEPNGGTITYKGRVVSISEHFPMPDVTACITNGVVVRASMVTQSDGIFILHVDVAEIDESYYLELVDKNGNSKKGALRAFGAEEYDYGDIPFGDMTPVVETICLTQMSESSLSCRCKVISQGYARVTERGLCWATNIPTINDNKELCGSGEGEFVCTVTNAGININTTTYYVRAYAKNEYGVGYGDTIVVNSEKLAYFSLPTMEYSGYTYHIHPDLGGMQWSQGKKACEELITYGYDDWYLPSQEEMFAIAEKTDLLNKSYTYWTSNSFSEYYGGPIRCVFFRYLVENNQWEATSLYGYNSAEYGSSVYRVIPVRKDR